MGWFAVASQFRMVAAPAWGYHALQMFPAFEMGEEEGEDDDPEEDRDELDEALTDEDDRGRSRLRPNPNLQLGGSAIAADAAIGPAMG